MCHLSKTINLLKKQLYESFSAIINLLTPSYFALMFKAVNTESEAFKKKADAEEANIREAYLNVMRSLQIEKFFLLEPVYDSNKALFTNALSRLLCLYVKSKDLEEINQWSWRAKMLEYKYPLLELAEKNITQGNYVKGRKLLNIAKSKGWTNNQYYDLSKRIEDEYFSESILKKLIGSKDTRYML